MNKLGYRVKGVILYYTLNPILVFVLFIRGLKNDKIF